MRAITRRCYGSPGEVLALERIAKPKPAADQILIKVRAASVNPYEWHTVTGKPYVMRLGSGIGKPEGFRVGYDMAGTVEAVGANVTRFKPGDDVFGGAHGALAEYALASGEDGDVVVKPPELSFEDTAALLIAGGTALQALRDYGHVAAGQKVLINGASGGVGTYAVQLAKAFGAEVTAVCSTRNVELVRSLGADHVIDYTKEDFTEGKTRYDLIVDNVGNHDFLDLRHVMTQKGTIVTVSGPKDNSFLGPITRIIKQEIVANVHRPEARVFRRGRRRPRPAALRRPDARRQTEVGDRPALSTRPGGRGAGLHRQPSRARKGDCHPPLNMKLRYKILSGVAAIFVLGYAALAITVSHDSPCPPVACTRCRPRSPCAPSRSAVMACRTGFGWKGSPNPRPATSRC